MQEDEKRNEVMFRAELLKSSKKFRELCDLTKRLAFEKETLDPEERALFSYAYKTMVGSHREAWRLYSSVEQQDATKSSKSLLAVISECKEKASADIIELCQDVIDLLDKKLLRSARFLDEKVFYLKMKGDYYRYLCECQTGEPRYHSAEEALSAYKEGCQSALLGLPPTNPLRLSIALNFSVFFSETLNKPGHACRILKEAFDQALLELDKLDEDDYHETFFIMQLMKDNIEMWVSPPDDHFLAEDGAGDFPQKSGS